jgi:hypothetical protein
MHQILVYSRNPLSSAPYPSLQTRPSLDRLFPPAPQSVAKRGACCSHVTICLQDIPTQAHHDCSFPYSPATGLLLQPPALHFYTNRQLELYAARKTNKLSLRQLVGGVFGPLLLVLINYFLRCSSAER